MNRFLHTFVNQGLGLILGLYFGAQQPAPPPPLPPPVSLRGLPIHDSLTLPAIPFDFCGTAAAAPPAGLPVRVYVVTNAKLFPNLPLPARALIFHNGLFAAEGADYDSDGPSFKFRPGLLADQDTVAVVTLP
jgi:hypothetical protein